MSRMSKPRSGFSFTGNSTFRTRPRKYPWVYDVTLVSNDVMERCQACEKMATHRVRYEERSFQDDLSLLYLCSSHNILTRNLDSWKDLFKLIDTKIEEKNK